MEVKNRLDMRLSGELISRGWRRQGTRKFIGTTHVVEMLPGAGENRVTVFIGRCSTPGNADRLANCSRITIADDGALDRFVRQL